MKNYYLRPFIDGLVSICSITFFATLRMSPTRITTSLLPAISTVSSIVIATNLDICEKWYIRYRCTLSRRNKPITLHSLTRGSISMLLIVLINRLHSANLKPLLLPGTICWSWPMRSTLGIRVTAAWHAELTATSPTLNFARHSITNLLLPNSRTFRFGLMTIDLSGSDVVWWRSFGLGETIDSDLDLILGHVIDSFHRSLDRHAPFITFKINRPPTPWLTPCLKKRIGV